MGGAIRISFDNPTEWQRRPAKFRFHGWNLHREGSGYNYRVTTVVAHLGCVAFRRHPDSICPSWQLPLQMSLSREKAHLVRRGNLPLGWPYAHSSWPCFRHRLLHSRRWKWDVIHQGDQSCWSTQRTSVSPPALSSSGFPSCKGCLI